MIKRITIRSDSKDTIERIERLEKLLQELIDTLKEKGIIKDE